MYLEMQIHLLNSYIKKIITASSVDDIVEDRQLADLYASFYDKYANNSDTSDQVSAIVNYLGISEPDQDNYIENWVESAIVYVNEVYENNPIEAKEAAKKAVNSVNSFVLYSAGHVIDGDILDDMYEISKSQYGQKRASLLNLYFVTKMLLHDTQPKTPEQEQLLSTCAGMLEDLKNSKEIKNYLLGKTSDLPDVEPDIVRLLSGKDKLLLKSLSASGQVAQSVEKEDLESSKRKKLFLENLQKILGNDPKIELRLVGIFTDTFSEFEITFVKFQKRKAVKYKLQELCFVVEKFLRGYFSDECKNGKVLEKDGDILYFSFPKIYYLQEKLVELFEYNDIDVEKSEFIPLVDVKYVKGEVGTTATLRSLNLYFDDEVVAEYLL